MRPIVIFENDPDFAEVLLRHLHNHPEGSYYLFPGLDEFEKSGLDPANISALFLDHHLDGLYMGNDVLSELGERGFTGMAYSMNNFSGADNPRYLKLYTRSYPSEKYDIIPKVEVSKIGEKMRMTIDEEIGKEGNLGDIR